MSQNTKTMTAKQLNDLFTQSGATPRDFIRWAEEHGAQVADATISRHRAGAQGITVPWSISYRCFFKWFESVKV